MNSVPRSNIGYIIDKAVNDINTGAGFREVSLKKQQVNDGSIDPSIKGYVQSGAHHIKSSNDDLLLLLKLLAKA